MKHNLGLASAIRTLTIFPVPGKNAGKIENSLYWFAFCGLLVGAFSACGALLAGLAAPMALFQSAIFTLLSAFFTRGFHLDGLADTADGFGGGWDKEQILKIMSDSRIGSFGVISIVCCLLFKFAGASGILAKGFNPMILILPASWARTGIVLLCLTLPYAKSQGKAFEITKACGFRHFAVCFLTSALFSAFFCLKEGRLFPFLAPMSAMFVGAGVTGLVSKKKIGGITGDVLGASSEISEALGLGALALFA